MLDKIKLTPKQEQFLINILYSPIFLYLWYVGGFGAGKSFTGCLAGILLSVLEPNNRGLISRSTLIDLKHTTKKTFEDVLELCGYIEGVHYTFTSTPSPTYRFSNGSEIIMMGLDDEQKIKGLEL